MTSYTDALQIILKNCTRTLPQETVPLVLSAGRVLSQDVVSHENIPAAANSAMDGYAVRAEDLTLATVETPARLRLTGQINAGQVYEGSVGHGQAVKIMTGGILPNGATAVVEIEATSEQDGVVQVRRSLRAGEFVRPAGEDVRAGSTVITAGKRLTPGDVGVLAALGMTNVPVRVTPKIAIVSTGNELVEPHRPLMPGQIRNSSGPALYALCIQAGAEPVDLGIAGDDREHLMDVLEQGLRFDVLVTTGGVSAGAYDLVQHLLPELGVETLLHHVNIKPGKPVMFGLYGQGDTATLCFGLPGNPVSSLVTFRLFVQPALNKMLGLTQTPQHIGARLLHPLSKSDGKRHFLRGILSSDLNGNPVVSTTGNQSSGAISSMSAANCLIILPEESTGTQAGETVQVEML